MYLKIENLISVDPSLVSKIAINLADINIMGKHPYIGYKKADKIIDYRNKKGPYKNISEIKDIVGVESYNRLLPYLKLWD